MLHPQSSWPFERPEQLADALREQGATPEECTDLLPAVRRLSEWQAPHPTPADTRRLLAWLATELPAFSPVRLAIREYRQHRISFLLATARAQVSLFGPGFWLVSALVTLLGAVIVLSKAIPNQDVALLVLRASGPGLSYLGTIAAFRGREARMLELELACAPSPLHLAIARLVIVLGYDVGLGLGLSLLLWAGGTEQVLALTLTFLMPLFLVAGLALLLTLRISVQRAASLAYGSWLAVLVLGSASPLRALLLAPALLVLVGCIGLLLLAIALLRIPTSMHRLLPHT